MFDREFHIHFTLADIGKALCFSPIVVGLVYTVVCMPWSSDAAPAWVQAIGSIAAVGAAIWISNSQALREKQERREKECAYMHKAFNTAFAASASATATHETLHDDLNDKHSIGVFLQQMRHSLEELDRFSYAEMADIQFADLFTIQQRTLRLLIMEVEVFLQGRSNNILLAFAMLDGKARQTVDELMAALEAYCNRFGVALDVGPQE